MTEAAQHIAVRFYQNRMSLVYARRSVARVGLSIAKTLCVNLRLFWPFTARLFRQRLEWLARAQSQFNPDAARDVAMFFRMPAAAAPLQKAQLQPRWRGSGFGSAAWES